MHVQLAGFSAAAAAATTTRPQRESIWPFTDPRPTTVVRHLAAVFSGARTLSPPHPAVLPPIAWQQALTPVN